MEPELRAARLCDRRMNALHVHDVTGLTSVRWEEETGQGLAGLRALGLDPYPTGQDCIADAVRRNVALMEMARLADSTYLDFHNPRELPRLYAASTKL